MFLARLHRFLLQALPHAYMRPGLRNGQIGQRAARCAPCHYYSPANHRCLLAPLPRVKRSCIPVVVSLLCQCTGSSRGAGPGRRGRCRCRVCVWGPRLAPIVSIEENRDHMHIGQGVATHSLLPGIHNPDGGNAIRMRILARRRLRSGRACEQAVKSLKVRRS